MADVVVVVPTIPGREQDLERCLAAYERTAPDARVIVEHGHPSCGEAWLAGAEKAGEFDYLHLTADDLEPHDGWLDVAMETVDYGNIPAPLVFHPDGSLESAGLANYGCYTGPFEDEHRVDGTTVPFLTCEMWDRIGMVPIHYCTDLWISTMGRRHGWETVIRTGMAFTHWTALPGRNYGRAPEDTAEYMRAVRAAA